MIKHADILLVEDNQTDAELVGEALKDANIPHTLRVMPNGEDALKLLGAGSRPDIILLDLNLPKLSGIEVLKEIKDDPILRVIPVIILTNSQAEADVFLAYSNYANAYIRKPLGFEGFVKAFNAAKHFWFDLVTLPFSDAVGIDTPTIPAPPPPMKEED